MISNQIQKLINKIVAEQRVVMRLAHQRSKRKAELDSLLQKLREAQDQVSASRRELQELLSAYNLTEPGLPDDTRKPPPERTAAPPSPSDLASDEFEPP